MGSELQEPHYLGHRKRLRERFKKTGLSSFQDYEAIELLLTLAIPRKDVKEPAKEAIKRFGSFRGVLDAPLEELKKIPGLGEVAPLAIRFIREAANLYLQPKTKTDLTLEKTHPETISLEDPVGTIHGICNDFLMTYRHLTPLGNNYEVLDELTQLLLFMTNLIGSLDRRLRGNISHA